MAFGGRTLIWRHMLLKVVRTMISLKGDRVQISEPKSRKSRRVVAIGAEVVQTLKERQAALSFRRGVRQGLLIVARSRKNVE